MDTLISLGTLAAWTWSVVVLAGGLATGTYFEVAAAVTTLILLGRFLEAGAKPLVGDPRLLELGAKEARVLREEVLVPAAELEVGDVFVVGPGEQIATDGVVVDGESAVDQSLLTGEPRPSRSPRARASPAPRSTPTDGSSSARRGSARTPRSRRSRGSSTRRSPARHRCSGSQIASPPSSCRSSSCCRC